ncbi:40S small subunit processome assembly factor 1 [Symphorus nematophorus]
MNSKTNGDKDEDCLFLEHVLDKLYDFGKGAASKKKLKKKKKRKRNEEEEEEEEFLTVGDVCSDTEDNRADHVGTKHQRQQPKTEQTGPSIRQESQVEVVTFEDPRKKPKTTQTPAPDKVPALQITEKKQSEGVEELSLEKARLEVHRFGITGYKKEQQRIFEQDRAVMLGARPPKKEYVNYKLLQEHIKEKKQKAKEEAQTDLKKKKKKQNNQRDKKKKVSSGSGSAPTGQVGRFKNGMLILSSQEIQKIKGNKRGK